MKIKTISLTLLTILFFWSCGIFNPPVEDVTDMIMVSGGTFTMGDVWGDGHSDETPTHEVTLSDFYIGKYEVTQKQFQDIRGANPSEFPENNYPVENVSWYDAVAFCNGLSDSAGLERVYTINGTDVTADMSRNGYRLPTEAEWEYAARSQGEDDQKWSGTNVANDLGDHAWFRDNSYVWVDTHAEGTKEVGTRLANDLGLYDMSGNVWEWCGDRFGTYPSSAQTDPAGSSTGSERVVRGGAWTAEGTDCRNANRLSRSPTWIAQNVGFRVARNAR
ncbi:MAG: SUMF1/EgtB/PvdO family nonheme iron enzyme [Candidatus Marinimicrobia bacterium]|nr:SUMF1/EgtB/PvdO family nonheme iron enzyme [Candidatus Neomarinimicrobiota bacterium]